MNKPNFIKLRKFNGLENVHKKMIQKFYKGSTLKTFTFEKTYILISY